MLIALDVQVTRGTRPKLPAYTEHVWEWFSELHLARQIGFNGWLPLANIEILAWCTLTGVRLRPWELAAIRALDNRFIHGQPLPDEPVTPALVKKLFGNG